jgi:putative membrane protein
MKTKVATRLFCMLSITAFLFACNQHDAVKEANTENAQKADSLSIAPLDEKDSKFLTSAASGGMMEVELGNIAQQQAANSRVKEFGAMMVRDHSKANEELKKIAAEKQVMLPAAMSNHHQMMVEDLKKKTGKDFDKAYMAMMVDDHKEDIEAFNDAAGHAIDSDVRGFAGRTLPTLQTHLDSATALKASKL